MKAPLAAALLVCAGYQLTVCQIFDYGISIIYNSSAHTHYDPTNPEDGVTQWNALGAWGAGAFISQSLSNKFKAMSVLSYQQKGYREIAQVGYAPVGQLSNARFRNTFHYLCADLAFGYQLFRSPTVGAFINVGIEYGYLIDYTIESDISPVNSFYPVEEYQDRWEKHNLSAIPSVALHFNEATLLEFGFNGSLTPVLETTNLIVRDWIWTFRVSQSIPALFTNKT